MMKKIALGLVGFVGFVGAATAAHIDVFSDTQLTSDATVGDGPTSTVLPTTMAGAGNLPIRTVSVDLLTSQAGTPASAAIATELPGGGGNDDLLSLSSPGLSNVIWSLNYDYTAAPIDLVQIGGANWDSLRLEGVQNNRPSIDVTFAVTDTDGDTATNTILNLPIFTGGMDFFVSYADFANIGATDFTTVNNILVTFDGSASDLGADLVFEGIFRNAPAAVPVPASLLLLVIGALTMRARKRA